MIKISLGWCFALGLVLAGGCAADQISGADLDPGGAAGAPGGSPGGGAGAPSGPVGGSGGGSAGSPGGGGPGGPGLLQIDLSGMDRFVRQYPGMYRVAGRASAARGVDRVEINAAMVTTDPTGRFETMVPVAAGVQLVEVKAWDRGMPQNTRKGHRSLLASAFLPEGEVNGGAAAMVLSREVLQALAAPLTMNVSNIDIASQLRMVGGLSQQGCNLNITNVTAGRPSLAVDLTPMGELGIAFVVPGVRVEFNGACSVPLAGTINLTGNIETNVSVGSAISAPPSVSCVSAFQASPPTVDLPGFDLDVSGGGGLLGLVTPLIGEIMEGKVRDTVQEQVATQATQLIAQQTSMLTAFNRTETVNFLGKPVTLGFCVTGLAPEGGQLRARLGLTARGLGARDAPGAPVSLEAPLPAGQPGQLLLDANLIGQIMFSLWKQDGIAGESEGQVNFGLLAALAPDLAGRHPDEAPVKVKISADLPPLVRAAPPMDGDLLVEMGDLMVDLQVGDEKLFRIGMLLKITLELEPVMGALKPTLKKVEAKVHVLEEPIADIDDDALEAAVNSQIQGAASGLFGDAAITVPSIGVPLVPTNVTAEPDGRYLRIQLQ